MEAEAEIFHAWDDEITRAYREVAIGISLEHIAVHVTQMSGATRTASHKRLRPMGGATKRGMGDMAPSASMWTHRTHRCVRG